MEASQRLLRLLAGSDLMDTKNARRVQDPLSFRCLAPVMGAAFDQLARAGAAIDADLNGAGDSPAVLPDDDEMLSTVNFDTTALALAFEGLGLAMSHAAAIAVFRIAKLMSPGFSDLPRFLTRHGGSRTGFATVQKTASALEAEIRHLASPLGPMTAPVADGAEDYAPMTPRIVEKTARDRCAARHVSRRSSSRSPHRRWICAAMLWAPAHAAPMISCASAWPRSTRIVRPGRISRGSRRAITAGDLRAALTGVT